MMTLFLNPLKFHLIVNLIIIFLLTFPSSSIAQKKELSSQKQILIVGTKVAQPFSMKDQDGQWYGISIELWEKIAKELNIKFEWKEHSLNSLLEGVSNTSLDAGIAAITVTSNREKKFDFSHSYYSTGLTIAIPLKSDNGWTNVIKGIFSIRMLQLVLMLFSILTIVGTIIWLVERNKSEYFNTNNPVKGIASGIWLAAVTMTTVGYGDIAPKSFFGKIITLIWMFASLLLVSVIIAGVASTLAKSKSEALVSGPQDLARARVASIKNSTSDEYLLDRKIEPTYYSSIPKALKAIINNEVDAVVYDEALLKYLIHKNYTKSLKLYDGLFESQFYGIAFPENSKLREPVNRVMLRITQSKDWQKTLKKYLGK